MTCDNWQAETAIWAADSLELTIKIRLAAKRGNMFGISSNRSIFSDRSPPRRPTLRSVVLSGPTVLRCRATATDISEAGCRISVPTNIFTGSYLEVVFTSSINAQGWVAWSKNGVIGINFVVPLSSKAVAQLSDIEI